MGTGSVEDRPCGEGPFSSLATHQHLFAPAVPCRAGGECWRLGSIPSSEGPRGRPARTRPLLSPARGQPPQGPLVPGWWLREPLPSRGGKAGQGRSHLPQGHPCAQLACSLASALTSSWAGLLSGSAGWEALPAPLFTSEGACASEAWDTPWGSENKLEGRWGHGLQPPHFTVRQGWREVMKEPSPELSPRQGIGPGHALQPQRDRPAGLPC